MFKVINLIILTFFSSVSLAQTQVAKIEDFSALYNTFEYLKCEGGELSYGVEELQGLDLNICEVVLKSPLCSGLEEDQKRNCLADKFDCKSYESERERVICKQELDQHCKQKAESQMNTCLQKTVSKCANVKNSRFGGGVLAQEDKQKYIDNCEERARNKCQQESNDYRNSCQSVSKDDPDFFDYMVGCLDGIWDSVTDLFVFLKDVMLWASDMAFDSEKRGESITKAKEYSESIALYLHSEYHKAKAQSTGSFRSLKALKKIAKVISKLLIDKIQKHIQDSYQQFSCLNSQAKAQMTCSIMGDIFVPPVAALTFLKTGKVVKMSAILMLAKKEAASAIRDQLKEDVDVKKNLKAKKGETATDFGYSSSTMLSNVDDLSQREIADGVKTVGIENLKMTKYDNGLVNEVKIDLNDGTFHNIKVSHRSTLSSENAKSFEKTLEHLALLPQKYIHKLDEIIIREGRKGSPSGYVKRVETSKIYLLHKPHRPEIKGGVLVHEFGHVMDFTVDTDRKKNSLSKTSKYTEVQKGDRLIPTEYGGKNVREDFAETFTLYSETDKKKRDQYRQKMPNRFAYLDEVMKLDVNKGEKILSNAKERVKKINEAPISNKSFRNVSYALALSKFDREDEESSVDQDFNKIRIQETSLEDGSKLYELLIIGEE